MRRICQELDHSNFTLAAMDVSEATLKKANDEFKGQRSHHKRFVPFLGFLQPACCNYDILQSPEC